MSSAGARITNENRGPAVNLASWLSLVTMCLITLLKVFSKLSRLSSTFRIRNLQADDYAILSAMVRYENPMHTTSKLSLVTDSSNWPEHCRFSASTRRAGATYYRFDPLPDRHLPKGVC